MNSVSTEMNLLPSQKYLHTAITIYAIMFMVYRCDFPEHTLFLGAINRLPVFQEIVVGVRADPQFTQQPAYAKFVMMSLDKPISL